MERGWWFPINSRKAHYFDDSIVSLCRKWMKLDDARLEDDKHESPQNCMECARLRKKLREKECATDA